MMAAAALISALALASCNDDPSENGGKTQQTIENDGTCYAFVYGGERIAALDTVVYTVGRDAMENDFADITFFIDNLRDEPMLATQRVDILQGPSKMGDNEYICGGGECPWDGQAFMLEPGINEKMPLTYDLHPSVMGDYNSVLMRLVVGDAKDGDAKTIDHATIIYLRINK